MEVNDRVRLIGTSMVGTVVFVATGKTMVTVKWDGAKEKPQSIKDIEKV